MWRGCSTGWPSGARIAELEAGLPPSAWAVPAAMEVARGHDSHTVSHCRRLSEVRSAGGAPPAQVKLGLLVVLRRALETAGAASLLGPGPAA